MASEAAIQRRIVGLLDEVKQLTTCVAGEEMFFVRMQASQMAAMVQFKLGREQHATGQRGTEETFTDDTRHEGLREEEAGEGRAKEERAEHLRRQAAPCNDWRGGAD